MTLDFDAAPRLAAPVDLTTYDHILVSTSAGKDSQAMTDYVVELARQQGVLDRVLLVHADLGRMEWQGTKELAAEHAAHYGLPLEVVRKAEFDGDLLNWVEDRVGKLAAQGRGDQRAWPMIGQCVGTSDFKTSQIAKVATRLAKAVKKAHGRAGRILHCVGLAKHESNSRCQRLTAMQENADGVAIITERDNANVREDKWFPITDWTKAQVWDRIKAAGTRHHYAYDLGMSRLSCAFCVAASESDLRIAGQHNPELAAEYLRVEREGAGAFKRGGKTLAAILGDGKTHLRVSA